MVPRGGADLSDLVVPIAVARSRRLVALSDPAGTQLRQCWLLVVGSGGRDRWRDESIDRGEGRFAGRAQIAVLRLLLHQRRVRRSLRRRDLPDGEEDL